ncbi:hypothetical protein BV22DRAFT_909118 [Leucogyrophana mollusca]|uniref:Uncharacterized protein n=1 Tax=Leucogyrophana mollusca TaxID=85980 RepID=A0ACB8AZY1_9AGAM|nr:hypothetical protein BV22DRAFT_909118 [Leucogyrophana mollusca]
MSSSPRDVPMWSPMQFSLVYPSGFSGARDSQRTSALSFVGGVTAEIERTFARRLQPSRDRHLQLLCQYGTDLGTTWPHRQSQVPPPHLRIN